MTKEQATREALELALEALEIEQAALAYEHGKVEHIENAITAIKEALAQPEQEPVAWMRDDEMKAMVSDEKRAWILCGRSELIEDYNKPLYTTPPQRTWVGLTDDEMSEIYYHADWNAVNGWEYERLIEAKLKEKNT